MLEISVLSIKSSLLWWRADTRNFSFKNSQWLKIYLYQLQVDKSTAEFFTSPPIYSNSFFYTVDRKYTFEAWTPVNSNV